MALKEYQEGTAFTGAKDKVENVKRFGDKSGWRLNCQQNVRVRHDSLTTAERLQVKDSGKEGVRQ